MLNEQERFTRNRKIIRLRQKGLSLSQIALKTNSTKRIVQRVISIEAPHLLGSTPSPRTIKPEAGKKILELRKQKVPYEEIRTTLKAEYNTTLKMNKRTLYHYVRRNAPELLREVTTDKKYLEKRMNQVIRLQRRGYTKQGIADELGLAFAKVNADLHKARKQGIPLMKHRKPYPHLTDKQIEKRDREMVRMKDQGKRKKEIAEKFDITPTRVSQILTARKPKGA